MLESNRPVAVINRNQQQLCNSLVAQWHQLGTNLVPAWSQVGSKIISCLHQLGPQVAPVWINQVTIWHKLVTILAEDSTPHCEPEVDIDLVNNWYLPTSHRLGANFVPDAIPHSKPNVAPACSPMLYEVCIKRITISSQVQTDDTPRHCNKCEL